MRHLPDCSARPIRTKVRNVRRHRRPVMTRWIAGFITAVALVGTGQAYAQDATPGPGTVVVTIIPGGGTFFTSNVGGGVNWYAGRWGLRGDYRFIAVQSKDDAPDFFGQETRYGHRIYGGVLLNVAR